MAENTKIEWCDYSFNPWWGCTKVGPGCDHCYAETWAKRTGHDVWGPGVPRRLLSDTNWKKPLKWNAEAYGRFGRPARVFCGSMCDWLDNEVPREWRTRLLELIDATPDLEWLLLSKRIGNLRKMVPPDWAPPNVRIGVTIVNADEFYRDIPKLRWMWSGPNFISYEPALGPVNWHEALFCIDWLICGGESGPNRRPFEFWWADAALEQCRESDTPFFFKQIDKVTPIPRDYLIRQFPPAAQQQRVED